MREKAHPLFFTHFGGGLACPEKAVLQLLASLMTKRSAKPKGQSDAERLVERLG